MVDVAPQSDVRNDYFRGAFEKKILIKMPEREYDHLTPATRVLEKRREMAEVELALIAQKEEFQMKMESLQQRREELERKEYHLKEQLLKFDKFLKENDSKRTRASQKATEERESRLHKEKEILALQQQLIEAERMQDKLGRRIGKYQKYQKFMEGVIELSDDFQEVREVTSRYETLTSTFSDLVELEQSNQELLETRKAQLANYIEMKHNQIMECNNTLAGLQAKLDKAQARAVEWEAKWNHVKNTSSQKTLQLGKLKMAAHNLYQLMVRHQTVQLPSIESGGLADGVQETLSQLDQVRQYILDLTDISKDIDKSLQS